MTREHLVWTNWFSRWVPAPFPHVAELVATLLLAPEQTQPFAEQGQPSAPDHRPFPTPVGAVREPTEPHR